MSSIDLPIVPIPAPADRSAATAAAIWREQRGAILVAFALLAGVVATTIRQWALDCWELDDFSHCLVVPLIAGWLLYRERAALGRCPRGAAWPGLALLAASLLLHAWGYLHTVNVFQRLGALGAFVGLAAFIFGAGVVRARPFPFFFLLLAVPVPFVYYSKISVELKSFVTLLAASILHHTGVPAMSAGNVLEIGELRLGVVDACSGIRSVMAILTVSLLLAYIRRSGIVGGALLVAMTLPIAIALNVLRVIVMAVAMYEFRTDLTTGWLHEALGLAIFAAIIALMMASWSFIRWLLMIREPSAP